MAKEPTLLKVKIKKSEISGMRLFQNTEWNKLQLTIEMTSGMSFDFRDDSCVEIYDNYPDNLPEIIEINYKAD